MGYSSSFLISSFLLLLVLVINDVVNGQPLVPALFIFGDSVVDAGNNNNRLTLLKANFPPYGRDFDENHTPTGRFSNGKLATDFTGFFEVRRGCCGTGLLEASILCNKMSIGTCANASQYIFWDGFHPTEAANKFLADNLIAAGISLIF